MKRPTLNEIKNKKRILIPALVLLAIIGISVAVVAYVIISNTTTQNTTLGTASQQMSIEMTAELPALVYKDPNNYQTHYNVTRNNPSLTAYWFRLEIVCSDNLQLTDMRCTARAYLPDGSYVEYGTPYLIKDSVGLNSIWYEFFDDVSFASSYSSCEVRIYLTWLVGAPDGATFTITAFVHDGSV